MLVQTDITHHIEAGPVARGAGAEERHERELIGGAGEGVSPSGNEHRILDHGALAVEQHGFPFGIGQAQIAFFPDAGVDHGLKRIEGGAEMLPEAAPALVVVGQPLGIGRGAEAVSVAVAHEGRIQHFGIAEAELDGTYAAGFDCPAQGYEAVEIVRDLPAFFLEEGFIVYDAPHLRRSGQVIEFAVAGYAVEHGGVVPAGERHTRKIEQAAFPVRFPNIQRPRHDNVGQVIVFQAPLVFYDAPVAGKVAHLNDIDLRKLLLDHPFKGIDGKGVFNEHGYRDSVFGGGGLGKHINGLRAVRPFTGRGQSRNRQKMILMPIMIASFPRDRL